MKKILMALALCVGFSVSANAAQFDEGKHYKVLETKHSSEPTITEFFSFYCPHCFKFEDFLGDVKEAAPEGTKINNMHVSFMGGKMGVPMAKAYATMTLLKVEDKVKPYIFKKIHEQGMQPKSADDIKTMFLDMGVSEKDFDKTYNSFVVDSMQKRFDKTFDDTGLNGVPGLLVNNKFVVIPNDLKSIQEYLDLVNFLLEK